MLTAVDTRPSRAQTDPEILAALGLDPAGPYRVDRTDPYRYLLLATDEAGTEGIEGLAMFADVAPGQRGWVLACVGCEGELYPEDAGLCPDCRMIAAAED